MRFQNLGGGLSISGQFVQCGKQDLDGTRPKCEPALERAHSGT